MRLVATIYWHLLPEAWIAKHATGKARGAGESRTQGAITPAKRDAGVMPR